MSGVALAAGIFVGSAAASTAAIILSDDSSGDSEGCNGHHWGEPEKQWDGLKYTADRETFLSANVDGWGDDPLVRIEELRAKTCEDCGETEAEKVTVAKACVSSIESVYSNDE